MKSNAGLGGRRFRPQPAATLFTALALAILLSLGFWQLHRLEWKEALIAAVEARTGMAPRALDEALADWRAGEDMEYLPVAATGNYLHEEEAHVFGTLDGAAGYYVFAPLAAADGPVVYVNRGFVPQALKERSARADGLPAGPVSVEGLLRGPEARRGLAAQFQPENRPSLNQWHVRDPAAFAAAAGRDAAPFYLDSDGAENPGAWPRGGTTRVDFNNRHLEYALTWFGLAGALLAVWLAFSLKRDQK